MSNMKFTIGDTLANQFAQKAKSPGGEIVEKINDRLLRMQGKLFKEQGISKDGLELAHPKKKGKYGEDKDDEEPTETLDKYLFAEDQQDEDSEEGG